MQVAAAHGQDLLAAFEVDLRRVLCGLLYLVTIIVGIFNEAFVKGRIFVPGDATGTAANLRSMELQWRLGTAGELVMVLCTVRARTIPAALAWLGVVASVLRVIALPARLGGVLAGAATMYVWMPMLVFELAFALWLMIKGVAVRASGSESPRVRVAET